jgi:hypothetical protein
MKSVIAGAAIVLLAGTGAAIAQNMPPNITCLLDLPVHVGASAFHFLCRSLGEEAKWYGISQDSFAHLAQAVLVLTAYPNQVIEFEVGPDVPCNTSICGSSTVPSAFNINRGFAR